MPRAAGAGFASRSSAIRGGDAPLRESQGDQPLGVGDCVDLDDAAVLDGRWPQLHIARAELLRRLHRDDDALTAYRRALELEPASPSRAFITRRMGDLDA